MSGPITTLVFVNPAASLLAAAGIRAAAAVAEAYQEAAALQDSQQQQQRARQAAQDNAERAGRAAQEVSLEAAEEHFDALITQAEQLGLAEALRATRPAAPAGSDYAATAAYVTTLQQLCSELRHILLTEAGRRLQDLPEQPSSIVLSGAAPPPQDAVQRLLARLAHLPEIPAAIRACADELQQTPPGERADLLTSELRRRIQEHLHALQQAEVQQATAVIVEQSLRDLGYQVEGIAETLFVQGGVAHFRRPGWGNYMVRMRIDVAAHTANFNVIRAVAAGENERSVLDHLAEDRWCAEFPALLQALEERGVQLQVTRRLQAGELPVQLVDAAKLPQFADEEAPGVRKDLARRL